LLQHVSVYINHHQGATACALPKLQYWLQYTSRWSIQYYGRIFCSVCSKGTHVKIYMNKLKWDQNIEKWIHKKREVGLTLLCVCIMHCAEWNCIRVCIVGHVRYGQARIVGLCQWPAAQQSICYACDISSHFLCIHFSIFWSHFNLFIYFNMSPFIADWVKYVAIILNTSTMTCILQSIL